MKHSMAVTGRLAKDPVIRTAGNGKLVEVLLSPYAGGSREGGYKESFWVKAIAWVDSPMFAVVSTLKKGDNCFIAGTPSVERYKNKDGTEMLSVGMTLYDEGQIYKIDREGNRVDAIPVVTKEEQADYDKLYSML